MTVCMHVMLWKAQIQLFTFVTCKHNVMTKSVKNAQQNYLAKMDMDSSVFLCKNPVFMSIWVCPGCGDTKWYHHDLDGHNDGIFTEKRGAVQVCFGEVVLL